MFYESKQQMPLSKMIPLRISGYALGQPATFRVY